MSKGMMAEIRELQAKVETLEKSCAVYKANGIVNLNRVEELEEFVKHDYMSMKNWQEEKTALQTKANEYDKFMLWLEMHSTTDWRQLYQDDTTHTTTITGG